MSSLHSLRHGLLIAISGLAVFTTTAVHVNAQTDFNIRAESEDLKSEFQKELDKWMLRAYEDDRDAQFKIAVLFANDQFGPPDNEQAAYWYTRAARQGHVLAQYNLGHQYLTGMGVKRDEKAAMQWWLKAAEQQHALAQFNVGRAYYLGIGLEKDLSQSKLWFERASQNKEPKSTEILKQLGWWNSSSVAQASQPQPSKQTGDESTTSLVILAKNSADTDATDAQPENTSSALISSEPDGMSKPIAVFTNPAVKSVLITIVNDANTLQTVSSDKPWSVVTSLTGFPVWVNKNFIRANGDQGTIGASSVNARSVPLITAGSVVGRLNKGESVSILDQRGDWYRVTAPKRFTGWVKSKDLLAAQGIAKTNQAADVAVGTNATNPITDEGSGSAIMAKLTAKLDDNEWLFKRKEDHYALQLASFSNPRSVEGFVENLAFRDSDDLQLFTTTTSDGTSWTYVVYGDYASKDAASAARLELKQKRAWIRRFSVLQQNRCIAWKKELPAPKELNQFCI